jgi:hypothetical protein
VRIRIGTSVSTYAAVFTSREVNSDSLQVPLPPPSKCYSYYYYSASIVLRGLYSGIPSRDFNFSLSSLVSSLISSGSLNFRGASKISNSLSWFVVAVSCRSGVELSIGVGLIYSNRLPFSFAVSNIISCISFPIISSKIHIGVSGISTIDCRSAGGEGYKLIFSFYR